jgi:hypothetical protein
MPTQEAKAELANDTLAALRKRKQQLEERIRQEERKAKAKEASQKRKDETRLRVLLGVSILADLPHHPEIRDPIKKIVSRGRWTESEAEFFIKHGWLDPSYIPKHSKPVKSAKQ